MENLNTNLTDRVLANIAKTLKEEDINLDSSKIADYDELSSELLLKLMDEAVDFYIKDNGELTIGAGDEEVTLDPKRDNPSDVEDCEKKLIEALPDFNIDMYFGGIKRKQVEATAAFKVVIVSKALNAYYNEEIQGVIDDYDFSSMRPKNTDGKTFKQMLDKIEQDSTSITKFLLACCSIMLTSKKQKIEKPYIGILPEESAVWLRNVDESISIIEADISKRLEKEPSKLVRLQMIAKKDLEIKELIDRQVGGDPKKRLLYDIMRLTSDSLVQIHKIKIKDAIRGELGAMLADGKIKNEDEYDSLFKKISRRALRQAVRAMQKEKYAMVFDPNQDISVVLPKI